MDSKVRALEERVRELHRALDYEKRHSIEAQKLLYKKDRKIKELMQEADEHKVKFKSVESTIGNLESELRIYKRKLEESQEISHHNSNRFRTIHQKYVDECGKVEVFEEQVRRRKAKAQNTNLFHQI